MIIIEAVARSRHPVTLAELAVLLGIDRSNAFRLANTLKRRGFLACSAGTTESILGPAIWRLSREYDWSNMLVKLSHKQLKVLAGRTGETAHLAVREGRQTLFIDHVTTNHLIAISGQTGELVPLHCTAHGKALLADFDEPHLRALFGSVPLKAYTKRSIVSLDQLARDCARIRAEGFATDDGEFMDGIRCVAAPIRDQDGAVIGSVGISAPLSRFSEQRYGKCGEEVLRAARFIHDLLSNQVEEVQTVGEPD